MKGRGASGLGPTAAMVLDALMKDRTQSVKLDAEASGNLGKFKSEAKIYVDPAEYVSMNIEYAVKFSMLYPS